MLAVSECQWPGHPYPSISSQISFQWTLDNVVRRKLSSFKLLILHVEGPRRSSAQPLQHSMIQEGREVSPVLDSTGVDEEDPDHSELDGKEASTVLETAGVNDQDPDQSESAGVDGQSSGQSELEGKEVSTVLETAGVNDQDPDQSESETAVDGPAAETELGYADELEKESLISDDIGRVFVLPKDFKDVKRPEIKRGIHVLKFFVKRCHELGIACEAWIKKGDIRTILPEEISRVKPDLLVLGSRNIPDHENDLIRCLKSECAKKEVCETFIIKRSVLDNEDDFVAHTWKK